jgi:hypothetical protein
VSHTHAEGPDFKLLGVMFDCQLTMAEAVRETAQEASWKLRTLLRTGKYYCDSEVMLLYKSHVLSYVEYRTPAVYHATDTVLAALERVQASLLRQTGISAMEALMVFNLAPLSARRDMAMLGLIHRTVLREGPAHFAEWFRKTAQQMPRRTRSGTTRHSLQLHEPLEGAYLDVVRRSALGLTCVYNMLPPAIVAEKTVAGFQRKLQEVLKERAEEGCADWARTFSPRIPRYCHPLR